MVKINIKQYSLEPFYYTKTFPGDSIDYYLKYYNDKFKSVTYIGSIFIKRELDSTCTFTLSEFNNIDTHYANWDSIVIKEQLKELSSSVYGGPKCNGYVCVPIGQEDDWITELKKYHAIVYAVPVYKDFYSVNCIR